MPAEKGVVDQTLIIANCKIYIIEEKWLHYAYHAYATD
jgi:hypothetical protein